MSIRIRSIDTRIVNHALRPERVIVSHAGRHDTSRFLNVTVHGDEGLRGYGEAATTPLWSGETAGSAQCIVRELLAPRLIGHTFEHPAEALARLDAATVGNAFGKGALETAVWDLWAKSREVRALELFADRAPPASIPTRASVGVYPPAKTLELAKEFWAAGIRTLKFKTGSDDDVERLRIVREQLGDEPIFTIDYNGYFRSAAEAVSSIESLLPFRLALVEQPTHRDRISLLAEVRRRVNVPILADEAIFTPDQLEEALALEAFDLLSIYPGKNGGFGHALEMSRRAQRAGKACTIGCNLETDLGQASMIALAAGLSAFPVDTVACDFPAVIFYERSSVTRPLGFREGRVEVPEGVGFGVEPLPEFA